jgi:hypothetical protein
VSVDDENAIAEDDDGGVAIHFVGGLGNGGVDALGHGLDVEEILGGEAGGWEQEEKKKREARFHGRVLRLLD